MSDKIIEKLKKKVAILEDMIEEETRSLFLEKEKVQDYSNYIETIIDSIRNLIITIDENGQLEFINKLAQEKFNVAEDHIDKLSIREILGDDIVDQLIASEKNTLNKIEVYIDDRCYFASRVTYTKKNSDKFGYIYSMLDITSLKEKEEIIEEQRALIVQNTQLASLGEMASGIAHEINNPVTIIDGQVRRLKDYLKDSDISDDERVELVDKIHNNLNRVVKIIDGIKKISRTGENDQIKKTELSEIIDSLKDLCHEKFKNNNVDLEFSGVEKNLCVKTRATQLLQVLFNLVSNSSDAIKNFETKWINVILDSDDQFVYIRIVDSGKGIDQVVLKKIFNPFFTTKDIGEGTGIGLSISRQMIADQGGKLVYDQYNGNTSFLITLKRA